MEPSLIQFSIEDVNRPVQDESSDNKSIKRQAGYRMDLFQKDYKITNPVSLSASEKCKHLLKNIFRSKNCNVKKGIRKMLPIFKMYKNYKIKTDLPSDAISGFTIGIIQIPQSMAVAMLADLPPVVGLYVSFFPVLTYFLLGTSRHISIGTVAVLSLMIGSIVSKLSISPVLSNTISSVNISTTVTISTNDPLLNFTENNVTSTKESITTSAFGVLELQKIALASKVCFLVGIIQVVFGVCRLGFVTTYMSDPLVSGFTTGVAVHTFTSQAKHLFGLKIPKYTNTLQIVYTYKDIAVNLPKTNIPTLITSTICIFILYVIKVQINHRFKHKLRIPIPIELILISVVTVLSYFLKFKETYEITTLGKIPAGLPTFNPPSLSGSSEYFSDALLMAILAFAQSVSLAALMAKKHQYTIDPNQIKFIAYGVGNICSSFFSCYPSAGGMARTSVQDSSGGRTQVVSLFSASVVLVVIMFVGPLFECLPICVLASIIVVALRSLFYQIFEIKTLWKISIYDFLVWIVTFIAVIFFNVDMGLWIGLIFSFLTVIFRTQLTKAVILQNIPVVNTYADKKIYTKTESKPGLLVISFNSPLYYANIDIFVKQVYQISRIKPEKAKKEIKRLGSIQEFRNMSQINLISHQDNLVSRTSLESDQRMDSFHPNYLDPNSIQYLHHIVIDCSSICFIDTMASKVLKQMCDDYKTIGIKVFLASVKDNVWSVLENTGFLDVYKDEIYVTVSDAVTDATENTGIFHEQENITHL